METKKLMAPRDGLLLLGLLLLAGILFLVLGNRPQGAAAIVERDGEILCRQELSALAAPVELEFEGEGGHRATLRISPEGGCFLASTCPDQTCVRRNSPLPACPAGAPAGRGSGRGRRGNLLKETVV